MREISLVRGPANLGLWRRTSVVQQPKQENLSGPPYEHISCVMEEDTPTSRTARPHNRAERPGHPSNRRSAAARRPWANQAQSDDSNSDSSRGGNRGSRRSRRNRGRGQQSETARLDAIQDSLDSLNGARDAMQAIAAGKSSNKDKDNRTDRDVLEHLHGEADLKEYYQRQEAFRIGRPAYEARPQTDRTEECLVGLMQRDPFIAWRRSNAATFSHRVRYWSSIAMIIMAVALQQVQTLRIFSATAITAFSFFGRCGVFWANRAHRWTIIGGRRLFMTVKPMVQLNEISNDIARVCFLAADFVERLTFSNKFFFSVAALVAVPLVAQARGAFSRRDKNKKRFAFFGTHTSFVPGLTAIYSFHHNIGLPPAVAALLPRLSMPFNIPVNNWTRTLNVRFGLSKAYFGWKTVVLWSGVLSSVHLCVGALNQIIERLTRISRLNMVEAPVYSGIGTSFPRVTKISVSPYFLLKFRDIFTASAKPLFALTLAWFLWPRFSQVSEYFTRVRLPSSFAAAEVVAGRLMHFDLSIQDSRDAKRVWLDFANYNNIQLNSLQWHPNEHMFDGVGGEDPRALAAQNRAMRIIAPMITDIAVLTVQRDWIFGVGHHWIVKHRDVGRVSLSALVSVIDGGSYSTGDLVTVLESVHRDAMTYHRQIGLPRQANVDGVWSETLRFIHILCVENVSARDRVWHNPADFSYGAGLRVTSGATQFRK